MGAYLKLGTNSSIYGLRLLKKHERLGFKLFSFNKVSEVGFTYSGDSS